MGGAESIILSVGGTESMMLSAFAESMILSAPVVTADIIAATNVKSITAATLPLLPPLSPHFPLKLLVDYCLAPPAERMILSVHAESSR